MSILLLVLFLLCITFAIYKFHFSSEELDHNLTALTSLKQKGNNFLQSNQLDSAMKCYRAISARYSESMSTDEKDLCARAFNNEGYIYFFYLHDNLQAYSLFLKALDISESTADDRFLPSIYLNIGNVFDNYNDIPKAISYYKRAFYCALKCGDRATFLKAFSNMTAEACAADVNNLSSLSPEITCFAHNRFSDGVDEPYNLHLYNGLTNVLAHKYKLAQCNFDSALLCVPNTSLSERDIAKVNFIKAKVYVLDNHYDSALVTLRRSLNLVNRQNDCDLLSSIYEWMASYNLKLGDKRSADTCMIRAYEIDRKYFNIQKFTTMRNIKASYDINKKDQQVALISEKKHTQELFFFIVLTCATVVILLGIVLYIGKRRQLQMTRKLYRNMVLKLNVDAREQKYKASNLEYEDKMKLLDKIIDVMKNCDEVYQMNFDLERLAHIVDAKSRYISQVINELCEKNFNALLAEYRVREACKRMRDKEHFGNISIEGIALSVGFKSRTNFAKIFKRETGLTPSEFYRMTR